ncbi:hypothetical protein BDC45DRAFT_540132 [Circinella umbellata]|nr:hypothetical protein BDC45DRAFT_540132 [Circinella umbellata]
MHVLFYAPISRFDFLPSWTGIDGEHIPSYLSSLLKQELPTTTFQNYTVSGRTINGTRAHVLSTNTPLKNEDFADLWNKHLLLNLEANCQRKDRFFFIRTWLTLMLPSLPYKKRSKKKVLLNRCFVRSFADTYELVPFNILVKNMQLLSCFIEV